MSSSKLLHLKRKQKKMLSFLYKYCYNEIENERIEK